MTDAHLLEDLRAKRARAAHLTVYHVGALIATFTAIEPEQLETEPEVEKHETHDAREVAAAFDAIEAAHPAASREQPEYRWKLVFADAAGDRVAEVYAAIFVPYGMIDGTRVRFEHDGLVRWLTERYAPGELPALEPRR